jgi:hypothetical protein
MNTSEMLKSVDVTEGAVENFQRFAEDDLFSDLPKNISYELYSFSTTLTYLNMKYFFYLGNSELSFILKGAKNINNDAIYTDYLYCSFAYVQNEEVLGNVRVFEANTNEFKAIFNSLIKQFIERGTYK